MHEWVIDEGSGSTAADRVGSADLSLSGPSWTSGTGVGDYYLGFDGADDEAVASQSDLQDYGDSGGVMFQTNIPSEPTERKTAFRENYTNSRLYFFLIDSEGDDLSVGLGDIANDASHGLDFSDWTFGNWTGVGLFWDSGDYDLHLYDFPSKSLTTGSATYSGSVQLEGDLGFMIDTSTGGRYIKGGFDFPRIFGSYESPSAVQSKFEEIAEFYE